MKQEIKVGDLVRVAGQRTVGYYHAFKYGQVVEVVGVNTGLFRTDVTLQGWSAGSDILQTQWLGECDVKLAKQAMHKREQYKNRR